jgi:branched-chain amino acid transport system substrate-binding protein
LSASFRVLISVISVALVFLIGLSCLAQAQEPLRIAVIGPMSGQDKKSGQAMVDGVRLQVDQVNEQGGIQGRKVVLEVYDNRHNKELAREQARKVADESPCLAVIGHYYSSLSLEGGCIYKDRGIPAVSGSAAAPEVTEDNDWYFRVISDNRLQGKLSALYMSGVLKQSRVTIVYEDDAYGRTLMQSFRSAARELGLDVQNMWRIDSQQDNAGRKLDLIVSQMKQMSAPGALYVALLDKESADLVRRIRRAGLEVPVLGGDSLGLGTFPQEVASGLKDSEDAGEYTNGIYATTYFIRDIANRKAQQFSREFMYKHKREPDALAATNYDAAGLVLQALAQVDLSTDLCTQRRQLRDILKGYSDPNSAYTGVTGHIYFDAQGNANNPSPFGLYVRDHLVSAPVQLTPVLKPDQVLDIERHIQKGDLLSFQEDLFYKTNVVYTGLDINEIIHIDQKNESFTADFYIWFRHVNPLDYSKIEFFNSDVHLGDNVDPMTATTVDDMHYRAYRIKAEFREPFQFHHYPFDHQTLRIRLRHKEFNRERLIFVADDIGMQRHKGSTLLSRVQKHSGFQGENKWELQNILAYSDIGVADSTLGNPRMFHSDAETGITYSRFNVMAEIKRNAASYIFKNMVPLFFIFLLGYAMTFIVPEGPPFAARLNLGVILLLTTVSLSLMTANQLPSIGYLVAMDYVYFFVYLWLLLGIIVTIGVRSAFYYSQERLHQRLEIFIRVLHPVLLFILLAYLLWLYG